MEPSAGPKMIFIDFNAGVVGTAPAEDRRHLIPLIVDALSSGSIDLSVRVPRHEDFCLQGGASDGSLSLGVFQNGRPIAIVYVGCGEGASAAWGSMDGMCHRVFGSPLGALPMPHSPWTVLVRFPRLRDNPSCDWLADFALEVGLAWAGQSTIRESP
jgi:hypothetical protein